MRSERIVKGSTGVQEVLESEGYVVERALKFGGCCVKEGSNVGK